MIFSVDEAGTVLAVCEDEETPTPVRAINTFGAKFTIRCRGSRHEEIEVSDEVRRGESLDEALARFGVQRQ